MIIVCTVYLLGHCQPRLLWRCNSRDWPSLLHKDRGCWQIDLVVLVDLVFFVQVFLILFDNRAFSHPKLAAERGCGRRRRSLGKRRHWRRLLEGGCPTEAAGESFFVASISWRQPAAHIWGQAPIMSGRNVCFNMSIWTRREKKIRVNGLCRSIWGHWTFVMPNFES